MSKTSVLNFQDYPAINSGSLDLLAQPKTPSERMRVAAPQIHRFLERKMPLQSAIPEIQIEDLPRLAKAADCTVSQIKQMIEETDPRRPIPAGETKAWPGGFTTEHLDAEGRAVAFLAAGANGKDGWVVWSFPIESRQAVCDLMAMRETQARWDQLIEECQPLVVCRVRTKWEAKNSLVQRSFPVTDAFQGLVSRAIYAAKTANRLLIEANQLLALASLGKASVWQLIDLTEAVYAELQTPTE